MIKTMQGSSFDFIQNNPIVPGQENNKVPIQNQQPVNQAITTNQAPVEVLTGGVSFTVIPDDPEPTSNLPAIVETSIEPVKKRRGRPRKKNPEESQSTEMVHAETVVENALTMYSYAETTNMTRQTIQEIDILSYELKTELDNIRMSKTLRNRNNYICNLSACLGQLLSAKLTAIREINSSISRSNELDYKKAKDAKASESIQNDDKYLMDLYNAFITNPGNVQQANSLGATAINSTVAGSGIVRASVNQNQMQQQGGMMDAGYLNYVSNMSPEQKMMFMEQDPNIQQVVVYDASSGNKFFQVMNVSTGEVITGVPVRSQMFMEDTTIDLKNKIARNINLNETYPVVVINEGVSGEY